MRARLCRSLGTLDIRLPWGRQDLTYCRAALFSCRGEAFVGAVRRNGMGCWAGMMLELGMKDAVGVPGRYGDEPGLFVDWEII